MTAANREPNNDSTRSVTQGAHDLGQEVEVRCALISPRAISDGDAPSQAEDAGGVGEAIFRFRIVTKEEKEKQKGRNNG